jgi:hypothetical protein
LTQLLRAKSITRYLPAKGKTGLALCWQNISILLPLPPARIIAVKFLIKHLSFTLKITKTQLKEN